MAGRISDWKVSWKLASGATDELAGSQFNLYEKILISTMPLTNSGNPTRAKLLTEITPSMGLLAFNPAHTPRAIDTGTDITSVTSASQIDLPMRCMTSA